MNSVEGVNQQESGDLVVTRSWSERAYGLIPLAWALLAISYAAFGDWGTDSTSIQASFGLLSGLFLAGAIHLARPYKFRLPEGSREFELCSGWFVRGSALLGEESRIELESEFKRFGRERWRVWLHYGYETDERVLVLETDDEETARSRAEDLADRFGLPMGAYCSRLPVPAPQVVDREEEIDDLARDEVVKPPIAWSPLPSVVERNDEEEIRTRGPRRVGPLAMLWVGYLLAAYNFPLVYSLLSIVDQGFGFDPTIWFIAVFMILLSATGLVCGGLMARPSWMILRPGEKTFRGGRGWLRRFRGRFDEVIGMVVGRVRKPGGAEIWSLELSTLKGTFPILGLNSGRETRGWVDSLAAKTGWPLEDRTGALPETGALEESGSGSGASAFVESEEQRAARDALEGILWRHRPRLALWRNLTGLSAVTCILSTLILSWFASRTGWVSAPTLWVLAPAALMGGAVFAWYLTQSGMAAEIEKIDSVAAVGPLLDLHAESSTSGTTQVRAALARLLRRLRPSDARSLSPKQREILRALLVLPLGSTTIAALRASCLSALEQIGNDRDVPPLESLLTRVRTDDEIADIRACIRAIHTRTDATRAGQTLLRAVVSGEGDELLRPAAPQSESDTSSLLRVAEPEEDAVISTEA
jgi:hypothetical protein